MKIIELQASNIKRLKAVDITPDGTLQIIGGKNAQGKSSVLDAIWLALGGGKAAKETVLPIREGESKASVTLDLGDLVVARSWTLKGTTLKVTAKDGATYSRPQKMLDELVGRLSFDPLAFTRLSAREQREALLELVDLGIDLDELTSQRNKIFVERSEVGRRGKAIGDVQVDETLPFEETSAQEIISEIRKAEEVARHNAEIERHREEAANEIADIEIRIADWSRKLEEAKAGYLRVDAEYQCLPMPADMAGLESQLATVEETNAKIRANNQARKQAEHKADMHRDYELLTEKIKKLDERKKQALRAARFPVEGLGFDDTGVTYRGVPFSQASSAEQIRVSLAMAMAMNPDLRVLQIKDGSLLDSETLEAIREQVGAQDFQLLIERVGDADEGAIIIEDGEVAE